MHYQAKLSVTCVIHTLDNQEEVGHAVSQIRSPMDQRIQEYLAWHVSKDERKRVFYSSVSTYNYFF